VETLLDEPSRLYFEAQFQWPSIPVPDEVRQATGGPSRLNPEVRRPSEYMRETDDYVKGPLTNFLLKAAE
jgi:hypothetical protein